MALATCPNREELVDYIAGKLADDVSDSLAEHLDGCPDCQAELATLPDPEDTLVAQLRQPVDSEPFLDEAECNRAVARAKVLWDEEGRISPSADASTTFFPQQLGEYQLLERLGRGGMGTVYKARQSRLDRVVALKILARGRTDDSQAIVRFEREMRAIGRLTHANIVQAFDAREIDGTLVLIMELIDGLDLAEIVRRIGPLPRREACEMVRQTALALQYAHMHGLVHRDIKPSNIMLNRSGEVKLLDLGLARFFENSSGGTGILPVQGDEGGTGILPVPLGGEGNSRSGGTGILPVQAPEEMTNTGQAMGTADYIAPEQAADSRSVDIRADIYSLGCTLYKLLSGRAPFSGPEYRGTLDKLNAHVRETPPSLHQFVSDLPEELEKIVERMLAKNPADRFRTPSEVAEALMPFCEEVKLPELISKALLLPKECWVKPEKSQDAHFITPRPATAPTRRRPIIKRLLIGMGFLGAMAACFAAGILITIKREGKPDTTVEVPEGSKAQVDAQGNLKIELGLGEDQDYVLIDLSAKDNKALLPPEPYKIGIGDFLFIRAAFTIPDIPIDGIYRVEPKGTVALSPEYGRVRVDGLSLVEAEQAIRTKLKDVLMNPEVSVTLAGWKKRTPGTPPPQPHRIASGDILNMWAIYTIPDQPIQGPYLVESDGQVTLGPSYGRVNLKGLTFEEAEEATRKKLAEILTKPKISITLESWRKLSKELETKNRTPASVPRENIDPKSPSSKASRTKIKEITPLDLLQPNPVPGLPSKSPVNEQGKIDDSALPTLPSVVPSLKQAEQIRSYQVQFGPEIEKVINAKSESKVSRALDLAAGKLHDLPPDFDNLPLQKQEEWFKANNIDLLMDFDKETAMQGGPNWGMLLPKDLKLAAIAGKQWEKITGEQLHSAFTLASGGMILDPNEPGSQITVATVREKKGVISYLLMPVSGYPPWTFAFQTRKGDLGMLQVIRYTEDPPGMRIRYKLVQPPPPPATTERSESSKPGVEQIKMFQLQYGDAATLAKIVSDILTDTKTPVRTKLRLTTDARTNSIIATGDSETLKIVEALLMRLDGADTKKPRDPSPRTTPSKPTDPKPTAFRTAKITRGDITSTIAANGTIQSEEVVDVPAQVNGRIVELGPDPRGTTDPKFKDKFVDYCTPVKKGDLLAKIDDADYKSRADNERAGLRRAEAELQAAQAKLDLAKSEWERLKTGNNSPEYKKPFETNYEVAKAAIEAAKATVEEKKNALEAAEKNLAFTTVKSPLDGVVIDRRVNQGHYVSESKNGGLFLIAKDIDKMEIWASVDEADISRIKEGVNAKFTVDVLPNEVFQGKVTQIRRNVTMIQDVVTYTVVIAIDNPDKKLLPYMTASVRFEGETRRNVLRVPNKAFQHTIDYSFPDKGFYYLWVLSSDKQKASPLPVEIGIIGDTMTEIRGKSIKEGMEVKIDDSLPSSSNPFKPIERKAATSSPVDIPAANSGEQSDEIPLAQAVKEFNAKMASEPKIQKLPPLSEDEIIQSLQRFITYKSATVSESALASLKTIVEKRKLPKDFELIWNWNTTSLGTEVNLFLHFPQEKSGDKSIQIRNNWIDDETGAVYNDPESLLKARQEKTKDSTPPKPLEQPVPPSVDTSAATPTPGGLSHVVPFKIGATHLEEGDQITIEEVRGTADTMTPGNVYAIKGTYRLASRDKALLAAYTTADGSDPKVQQLNNVPDLKTQSTTVKRGEGKFSLVMYMWSAGKPHISFYPASGGEGFASVYFGTGDSLLERGWWEKEKNPAKNESPPAVNLRDELQAFDGSWIVEEIEPSDRAGWPVFPWSDQNTNRLVFSDGQLTVYDFKNNRVSSNAFQINPNTNPQSIDFFPESGGKKTLLNVGIYHLDGDRMKIRLTQYLPNHNLEDLRPKSFSLEPNAPDAVLTLRRFRPTVDEKALDGRWQVVGIQEDGKKLDTPYKLEVGPVLGARSSTVDMELPAEMVFNASRNCFSSMQRAGFVPHGASFYLLDSSHELKRITFYSWNKLWYLLSDFAKRAHFSKEFTAEHRAGMERALRCSPGSREFSGIYRFEGDRLTIAFRQGGDAPEKFESTPGSGVTLFELKRGESNRIPDSGIAVEKVEESAGPANPAESKAGTSSNPGNVPSSVNDPEQKKAIAFYAHLGGMFPYSGDKSLENPMMYLDLKSTKVTDADLENLKALPNLEILNLTYTTVTDGGLKHLAGTPNLRSLNLDFTKITDAGLEHVKGLKKLNCIFLYGAPVTDAGLEHLKGMAELTALGFATLKITDAGLEHLKDLTKLGVLELYATQVTDAGLIHLEKMVHMRKLGLSSTAITDAGLKHLAGMTELESLDLRKTQVTAEGVRDLQPKLPNCKIQH